MNTSNDILFERHPCSDGNFAVVTLNRPQALNALTHDMIVRIDEFLAEVAEDPSTKAVVLRANGERAFCAGGDIRYVCENGHSQYHQVQKLFWHEYRLMHRIYHFPKPYVALMHGVTMGGGVGLAANGSHRVGGETLMMAMPETGIGFFPDVGASYFLSRIKNLIGVYMGLTGARLKIADALEVGLVDYHIPTASFPDVLQQLAETSCDKAAVERVLLALSSTPAEPSYIQKHSRVINECFNATTVDEVITNLNVVSCDFCITTLKQLLSKSPTSLKVTMQQLYRGARFEFDECLKMEYRLVSHFLTQHDFYEGVRALLIDKDNQPHWRPSRLEDVSSEEVEAYFNPPIFPDLHFGGIK